MLEIAYDGSQLGERRWMREALHDLCQPLTALECCLYVGTMAHDGAPPTPEDMRETIGGALTECERLMSRVRAMQERLHENDGGRLER